MRYLFDDFALDLERRELRRNGELLPLAPQVFDLIVFLIRHRERVVAKEELVAEIWKGRPISDSALTTRLNVARSAIGDRAPQHRLIKTHPRRGFRFIGQVREDADDAVHRAAGGEPGRFDLALSRWPSVTVLPFRELTGDPDLTLLGHGIAGDVSIELCQLRWLVVVSPFAAAETEVGVTTQAQNAIEPGVRYRVEGSVRRLGERVRVTIELVDIGTGIHLWARRYDRSRFDPFASHDENIQAMAMSIGRAIALAERRRASRKVSESLLAWEAYQLGTSHLSRSQAAENRIARSCFERAVELDPNFGPSYAALAWSYMASASAFSEITIAECVALSEPLVRKAVALEEDDPIVRARLALTSLLAGDLEAAVDEAERALSIDSHCADAHGVRGAALIYAGRRQDGRESIARYLRARTRDLPRPIRLTQVAISLYLDGAYDQASRITRHVTRQYPRHPFAYRWLAASLGQLGQADEAQAALRALQSISPTSFEMYVNQPPPAFCSVEYGPMLEGLRKAGWKQ